MVINISDCMLRVISITLITIKFTVQFIKAKVIDSVDTEC